MHCPLATASSSGTVEGPARVVSLPTEFDQVKKGDVLVCKVTNLAWVVPCTEISGLVTGSGGALSHPALVSREFGLPAVVGTTVATKEIRTSAYRVGPSVRGPGHFACRPCKA